MTETKEPEEKGTVKVEKQTEEIGEKGEEHGLQSQSTDEDRLAQATGIVKMHMYWALGFGFIPIPLFDLMAVSTIQMKMLYSLCKHYGVTFHKNMGKSLVSAILGGLVPATLSLPAASFIKLIPIVGQTTGALTMPVFAAASTYAVGSVFVNHFELGGTLLTLNPTKFRELMNEKLAEGQELVKEDPRS